MRSVRIKRTNKDDLVFTGELLAMVDDQKYVRDRAVGLELSLYQTAVGKFILAITIHDYQPAKPESLCGAVSFSSIKDIFDFCQSREGRGIADLVLLLLEQVPREYGVLGKDKLHYLCGPVENREVYTHGKY